MTELALLLQSDTWVTNGLQIILQCTLICGLTVLVALGIRRHAALRQTILRTGLICSLVAPGFVWGLDLQDFSLISVTTPTTHAGSQFPSGRGETRPRKLNTNTRADRVTTRAPADHLRLTESEPSHDMLKPAPAQLLTTPETSPQSQQAAATHQPFRITVESDAERLTEHPPATGDLNPLAALLVASSIGEPHAATGNSLDSHPTDATPEATPGETTAPEALDLDVRASWLAADNLRYLLAIWAAGSGLLLIGIGRSLWNLRRLTRQIQPQTDPRLAGILDRIQADLQIRSRPEVGFLSGLSCPIAVGFRRSRILIPAALLQQLDDDELHSVLLHETAHILHHDHFLLLVERLFVAVFWMHPLAHILRRLEARTREEVCDNYVLRYLDRTRYSEVLLRLAQAMPRRRMVPAATGLFGSHWKLEQRIAGLLDDRRNTMVHLPPFSRTLCVAGLATVLLGIGSTRITAQPAAPPDNSDLSQAPENETPQDPAQPPQPDAGPSDPFAGSSAQASADLASPADAGDELTDPTSVPTTQPGSKHSRRVGYVNVGKVLKSTERFNREIARVKAAVEQSSRQMQERTKEIAELSRIVKTLDTNMEAAISLQALIDLKRARMAADMELHRRELISRESATYLDAYRELKKHVQTYAQEHNLVLVLRTDEQQTDPFAGPDELEQFDPSDSKNVLQLINRRVIYARDVDETRIDITQAIIDRLNRDQ